MSPSKLKVGVIRYFQNQNYVPHHPSFQPYLDQLLALCGSFKIADRHGKTIYYRRGQRDVRRDGPVLAIGDAISSINPLGWEGIRHAMATGRYAANTIANYLKGKSTNLKSYEMQIERYFSWKWYFSEKMMDSLFKTRRDSLIDLSVRSFQSMSNEELMKVVFGYKYRYSIKSYFLYLFRRLFK